MKRHILFLWFVSSGLLNLYSQKAKDSLPTVYTDLREVVLTANKKNESREDIPQRIHILKRRTIQQLMPQNTGEALIQNGNVFVQKSQMGGGSPVIRGFEANSILLVVDGVRMNNAIYRGGHLQNVISVDANALERVEVLAGPGSVIYGSDALGGVLHMYTISPEITLTDSFSYSGSAFARYASANNENSVHAHVNYGKKNWAMVSSFTFSSFGDLRMGGNNRIYKDSAFGNKRIIASRINNRDTVLNNPDPLVQTLSGYSQVDLMQKFLYQQNKRTQHLLNLQYSESSNIPRYDRLSQLSTPDTPRFSEWFYGPQRRFLAAYVLRKAGKAWYNSLNLTGSYQYIAESRNQRRFGNDFLNNTSESLNIWGINLDLLKEYKGDHELRYGGEVILNTVGSIGTRENIRTGQTNSIDSRYPDGAQTLNTAIYASYRWELDTHWILSAGARLNHYRLNAEFDPSFSISINNNKLEQINTTATGHLGMVYKPIRYVRLTGQLGTGFRNPNVDDLAKTFERDGGTIVLPISTVKPEQVFSQELGADFFFGRKAWLELRVYNTDFRNAIATLPTLYQGHDSITVDGRRLQVLSNSNIDRARVQGASVSLRYRVNRVWSVKASWEYTQGRDISNKAPLSHIPPAFGSIYVNYTKPRYSVLFYTLFNAKKPISEYSISPTDNPGFAPSGGTPAWYTLNIKGRYNFTDRFRAQAGVENILDLNYRYFASGFSAAGRNVILSLNYSF